MWRNGAGTGGRALGTARVPRRPMTRKGLRSMKFPTLTACAAAAIGTYPPPLRAEPSALGRCPQPRRIQPRVPMRPPVDRASLGSIAANERYCLGGSEGLNGRSPESDTARPGCGNGGPPGQFPSLCWSSIRTHSLPRRRATAGTGCRARNTAGTGCVTFLGSPRS